MQTLGIATDEQLKQLDDEAKAQVQDAVEFAESVARCRRRRRSLDHVYV